MGHPRYDSKMHLIVKLKIWGSVTFLFTAITLRSTLNRSGSTCSDPMGQIDPFKNYSDSIGPYAKKESLKHLHKKYTYKHDSLTSIHIITLDKIICR